MATKVTASKLRENVYRILDEVLATGKPVEIDRKGRTLKIIASNPTSRLAGLKRRRYLRTEPDDIVHIDWSRGWRP